MGVAGQLPTNRGGSHQGGSKFKRVKLACADNWLSNKESFHSYYDYDYCAGLVVC